jgi:hypothetical protein
MDERHSLRAAVSTHLDSSPQLNLATEHVVSCLIGALLLVTRKLARGMRMHTAGATTVLVISIKELT